MESGMLTRTVVAQWPDKWSITCAVTCPTQDLTLPCFTPVTDSVAVSNAGINLTRYHPNPPPPPPRPLIFSIKISAQGTAFQCQTLAPVSKKRNKIPTPRHNFPSSNAKISMKKEHNSIKATSFFPNFP